MWTSAPGTSQLISRPGTMVRGGCLAASSMAPRSPSVEAWSVTASTRTPRRAAARTSSRGVSVPSDAVVCECRSTPAVIPAGGPDMAPRPPRARRRPGEAVARLGLTPDASFLRHQVTEHRAHGRAGGALGAGRGVLLDERGARDVQMRPRAVARELLEEEPRGDGAAAARADVVEIGDVALEVLAVLVDEGQLPDALAGVLGGGQQPVGEPLIVREQARAQRAKGDDAGARERGHVDHLVGLDLLRRVAHRVGEREASLGVRVADLHGDTVHRAQYVARADGGARRHVLGGGDEAVHL